VGESVSDDMHWDAFRRAIGDETLDTIEDAVAKELQADIEASITGKLVVEDGVPALPDGVDMMSHISDWSRRIMEERARKPLLTQIIVHHQCPNHWCKPLYRTDGTVHVYMGWAMWVLMKSKITRTEVYGGKIPVHSTDLLPAYVGVPVTGVGLDL
jgi:hypothetical protein